MMMRLDGPAYVASVAPGLKKQGVYTWVLSVACGTLIENGLV